MEGIKQKKTKEWESSRGKEKSRWQEMISVRLHNGLLLTHSIESSSSAFVCVDEFVLRAVIITIMVTLVTFPFTQSTKRTREGWWRSGLSSFPLLKRISSRMWSVHLKVLLTHAWGRGNVCTSQWWKAKVLSRRFNLNGLPCVINCYARWWWWRKR